MCVLVLDLVELRPRLVQLLLIGRLRYLPDKVSGSTIVQGLVGSPGNVLQPRILVLQLFQSILNPSEGIILRGPHSATWPPGLVRLLHDRMEGEKVGEKKVE